jgi:hypothetical protein
VNNEAVRERNGRDTLDERKRCIYGNLIPHEERSPCEKPFERLKQENETFPNICYE